MKRYLLVAAGVVIGPLVLIAVIIAFMVLIKIISDITGLDPIAIIVLSVLILMGGSAGAAFVLSFLEE